MPDGVGRDVEDAVLARDGDVDHRLYGGAVEVVVVLSGLDEEVRLDVALHLLHGGHEVVVAPVHLVVATGPRRVRHAGTEPLGELQRRDGILAHWSSDHRLQGVDREEGCYIRFFRE